MLLGLFQKWLGGNSVGLSPWDHITIAVADRGVLTVTGTPARHGPADGDRGPVIGFVLHREGTTAPTIYVSGDTVLFDVFGRRFSISLIFAPQFSSWGRLRCRSFPHTSRSQRMKQLAWQKLCPTLRSSPFITKDGSTSPNREPILAEPSLARGLPIVCYGFQVAGAVSFR